MNWQQRRKQNEEHNDLTVICPYPVSLLIKQTFEKHKHQITHNHSITIDTTGRIVTGYTKASKEQALDRKVSTVSPTELSTRVIIAEPEPDLRQLYGIWLRSMGFKDIVITDSGKKCVDEILNIMDASRDHSQPQGIDIIVILDTHLKDISCLQVAKQILDRKPEQRIIFTATLSADSVRDNIVSIGVKNNTNEMVLTKPFGLSKLSSLIGKILEKH